MGETPALTPHFSCDLLSFPARGISVEAPNESFPAQGEDLYGWFEGITEATETENLCGCVTFRNA